MADINISAEEKAELQERLALYEERLLVIPDETKMSEPFRDFFEREARFLSRILNLYRTLKEEKTCTPEIEILAARNRSLYEELFPGNYDTCYGNPDYAIQCLGEGYGRVFSALYTELRGVIAYIYEDRIWDLCVCIELFLEYYGAFSDEEMPSAEGAVDIFASYNFDYGPEFVSRRISEQVDPDNDFALKLIMESDLKDLRYLYSFGEYVSENEIRTAEFLNSLSQDEIDSMARIWTEGYRLGFIATGKDIKKKTSVNIRYSLGFERMVRSAVLLFEEMGLRSIIYRSATHCVNKARQKNGYFGADPNPQFAFDHTTDEALYLDEKFVSGKLSAMRKAFEENKDLSNAHGGPACMEVFGEKPFVPKVKKSALSLSESQRELKLKLDTQSAQIVNRYIKGEERSYTIIAYPMPEIGPKYKEIFMETVRLNTLDYETYQKLQQKIIDALDKGDRVVIRGRNGNMTDITVKLHELSDPLRQTNFENCVADVNIPVGEVFTSPVLKGTGGLLHVSEVYLEGLRFEDLKIEIKDGMTAAYSCGNFNDPADGEKYIKENILSRYDSLPMGEFAIGTNTTAYAMAKRFDIFAKLPILIAEKTGPHFAFGDTCYSREEDLHTYNPDGKELIAKENEVSALRKSDEEKAYFNCHTDITIPYDELGCIYLLTKEDEKIYIIDDGKFVLEGCEELNLPL